MVRPTIRDENLEKAALCAKSCREYAGCEKYDELLEKRTICVDVCRIHSLYKAFDLKVD